MSTIGDQPDSVELRYQDENIWLTQRLMAELYGVDVPTINYHIQQIYKDNELTEGATIRNFLIVQTEGTRQVTREVKLYVISRWLWRIGKRDWIFDRFATLPFEEPDTTNPE